MNKGELIEWCYYIGSVYDVNKTIALLLFMMVAVLTTYLIKNK